MVRRLKPVQESRLWLLGRHRETSVEQQFNSVPETSANSIKWCAVGVAEMAKCGVWSMNSVTGGQPDIECQNAVTADDCVKKIMRKEADAITLDGGQVYTAGKCGLVPVMVEQYDQELCGTSGAASSYTAVAVVKKGSGVTWANLKWQEVLPHRPRQNSRLEHAHGPHLQPD
ncbi:Serotransferrin Precursor [Larimichthys crocea]|uniref:Serotransferrin n=1 Tax=Larimichthys crocea TaxID=215358 RepID=A0A6G0IHC9_LARCR|nr:Serotransferrin Precursor [Larimichthys crocea]